MKRILRTLLAAVGVLGLVLVGAVVFITTFFDPEDLKPRLIDVVREHSGLELELDGPLSWSFYPRLGVGVASAEARLPGQAAEAEPFAAFDHAEVSLAMAPLLRGEIAIDGLTLDGLDLNLERDAEGRGNWQTLIERLRSRSEQAESVLAPASAGPNPGASGLDVALNIASVQLRNGHIDYRDLQAGRELMLSGVDITGSNVNPDKPFPLSASLDVALNDALGAETPRLASQLSLETQVSLGLAEGRHVLEGLSLSSSTRLDGEKEAQEAELDADQLVLDLSANRLKVNGGQLDVGLMDSRLGDERLPLSLAFGLDADLADSSARFSDLALTGPDGLDLDGSLTLTGLEDSPAYNGQLRLAELSLRPWLERFDVMPDMASDEALSQVALTSPIEGDLEHVTLDGLNLSLDGSTFNGRLGGRFDGARLEADLQGDRLVMDDYLPSTEPSAETAGGPSLPGVGRAIAQNGQEPLLPADWLAALSLDAKLSLGELILMGQTFSDVSLTLVGDDGRQRLVNFESGLHEGRLLANGELDARETPLRWQLSPRIENLRLGSLLASLGEEPAPIEGRLNAEGELTTRGNSVPELKRALNGQLDTQLAEGRLPGVNVSQQLCTTAARLEGNSTSREWAPDTRLQRAEASFRIRDGVAESDDLSVAIPGVGLGGNGSFDLTSERFDLRANARFTGEDVDAACEVNPRLVDVPFPVRCEGQLGGDSAEWCRFDRDAFRSTLGDLLRGEVSQRANDKLRESLGDAVKKLDERIDEDSRGELRDALKGLFN
ncbi:AsmA family protein [Halomonas getboli]|uniref:AsmA family protein n=1 Tax=Halomonas getboli TaxID=2935862 RepID=UPI001FFEA57A|nr:AsmA family protein [Halomonas getboli]MCK2183852.1 AsmA family protein [Halomonas getboli]